MRRSSATLRMRTAGESPKSSARRCSMAVAIPVSLFDPVVNRTFPVWMYVVTSV